MWHSLGQLFMRHLKRLLAQQLGDIATFIYSHTAGHPPCVLHSSPFFAMAEIGQREDCKIIEGQRGRESSITDSLV